MGRADGNRTIVGIDETGRGSCCGPIFACALMFRAGGASPPLRAKLADSKELSSRRRLEVASRLREEAAYALGCASAAEVDLLNPLRATMLAMGRAQARLATWPGCWAIVDGPHMPTLTIPGEPRIRADSTVEEVMAASIVAKCERDRLMAAIAVRHPGYGLERHAGYGTAAHFRAISALGPTRHHRSTFIRRVASAAAA